VPACCCDPNNIAIRPHRAVNRYFQGGGFLPIIVALLCLSGIVIWLVTHQRSLFHQAGGDIQNKFFHRKPYGRLLTVGSDSRNFFFYSQNVLTESNIVFFCFVPGSPSVAVLHWKSVQGSEHLKIEARPGICRAKIERMRPSILSS
jgi:hypothetical protein